MHHEDALAMARFVVEQTSRPVSVFVADDHGEVVVAITMDGAAHDTRLNAQRKAYTAARSHLFTSGALGDYVRDEPVDRESFDPFFTFFQGGVAAFRDGRRVGSVAVSGLTGDEDEDIALRAIEHAGLNGPPAAG
jgi:glc operon protein GlcG